MEINPTVLLVDSNPTALQCAARALRSLEVDVVAFAELPEDAESQPAPKLLVVDCSRIDEAMTDRLERWLDRDDLPLILPLTPQPEEIPEELLTHPRYVQSLEKPFTPTELCVLALTLEPSLNNELDPDSFVFSENLKPLADAIELDMDLSGAPDDDPLDPDEGDLNPVLAVLEDLDPDVAAPGDYALSDVDFPDDDPSLDELDLEVSSITPLEDQSVDNGWPAQVGVADDDEIMHVSDDDMLSFDDDDLIDDLDDAEMSFATGAPSSGAVSASLDEVGEGVELLEAELIEVADDAILEVVEDEPGRATAEQPVIHQQPPPLPPWAVMLDQLWPLLSMETTGYHRASLLASLLSRHGMPADPYWSQPGPAERCDERLDSLRQLDGFHGTLGQLRPMVLFRLIRERQFSGSLELFNATEAYRLTIWGDTLRYLEPRQPSQELLLGHILVARGELSEEALQQAMEAQYLAWSGGLRLPLGRLLVDRSLVSPAQLEDALKVQARGYFFEICNMRDGSFIFREEQPGEVQPFGPVEPIPLNFQVTRLLIEMMRQSPLDNSGVRVVDNQETTRLVVNPAAARHVVDGVLNSEEQEVLGLFSTELGSDEVHREQDASVDEINRIVRRLHRLGLLDQV